MKNRVFYIIIFCLSFSFLQAQPNLGNEFYKRQALSDLDEARRSAVQLDSLMAHQLVLVKGLQLTNAQLNQKIQELDRMVSGGASQQDILNSVKQIEQMQMSFNLQYIQLQNQMQHENRSYTAISNIMKTKHDTVKNSVSNIR